MAVETENYQQKGSVAEFTQARQWQNSGGYAETISPEQTMLPTNLGT
ncbi:uncharacterized protein METZ01_LOCUS161074 [marine metagenome]|uniref:Uncharacterized protein n=1 Tax=marine metagenome TaxID=408172 RepID=A0A382B335_9ZZZZ